MKRFSLVILLLAAAGCKDGPTDSKADRNNIDLAVGEALAVTGEEAAELKFSSSSNAEYLVVPFNASTARNSNLSISVTADGAVPAPGFSPQAGSAFGGADFSRFASTALQVDADFETQLRKRERRELTSRVEDAREAVRSGGLRASRSITAAPPPAEGTLLTFNVRSDSACVSPRFRTARVVAVTQRAVILADTSNPAGGITDEEYRSFGIAFDTLVYPVVVEAFGAPADIDGNQRVNILYTRAVNELTEQGESSFVGGFFFARDLFPKQTSGRLTGCEGSNQGEMFYMLAADPNGEVNGNPRSRAQILRGTVATIAHEFQHLINASRRLYVINSPQFDEEIWLNEGLSHIAEELVFYRASGLSPRRNISVADIRASDRVRVAFNSYAIQNFARFEQYLEEPEANSPYDSDDDLATRGAIWAFLRYAADRRNGNDTDLWQKLVNSQTVGLPNLQAALGTEPRTWVREWTVSVYTDDVVPAAPREFMQPSWQFRDIYRVLTGTSTADGTYPLRTRDLGSAATQSFTLKSGSGAFLKMGVPAGGTVTARFTSGGAAPPKDLQISIVRIR